MLLYRAAWRARLPWFTVRGSVAAKVGNRFNAGSRSRESLPCGWMQAPGSSGGQCARRTPGILPASWLRRDRNVAATRRCEAARAVSLHSYVEVSSFAPVTNRHSPYLTTDNSNLSREPADMKLRRTVITILLSVACVLGQSKDTSVKPDNTKVNKRDRSANEPTADQQK